MYVNFLSAYSDKKSCHTSTTLQTSMRGLSAIDELLVMRSLRSSKSCSHVSFVHLLLQYAHTL